VGNGGGKGARAILLGVRSGFGYRGGGGGGGSGGKYCVTLVAHLEPERDPPNVKRKTETFNGGQGE